MAEPPKPPGMLLYADLLADPQKKSVSGSTISGAPVRYNLKAAEPIEAAAAAPKKKDASLQFQPNIKRPQPKAKPRAHAYGHAPAATANAPSVQHATEPGKGSSIEFWLEKGNDHNYVRPKPKQYKAKKSKRKRSEVYVPDWDEIYDPSQPNTYRAYKGSEEQYREMAEWKDRLYFRVDGTGRGRSQEKDYRVANPMFAPPPIDTPTVQKPASFTNDATGDDAFARRARMTAAYSNDTHDDPQTILDLDTPRTSHPPPRHSPEPDTTMSNSIPDTTVTDTTIESTTDYDSIKAAGQAKAAITKAKLDALRPQPPPSVQGPHLGIGVSGTGQDASTISRVPVPYAAPGAFVDIETPYGISRAPVRYGTSQPAGNSQPTPLSTDVPTKVKKAGFGQRMLEKQGWKKGQGLGADSQGITTAISVQAEKRKKRADADGGGWEGPRNMGKIVGGKKQKTDNDADPVMSAVVKLPGILNGLNVRYEIEEKNLQQELGDWFNENYGTVERVYIWRKDQGGNDEVFIKFTNAISALKAVNPADVLTFADNEVKAAFFDAAKFESGDYA